MKFMQQSTSKLSNRQLHLLCCVFGGLAAILVYNVLVSAHARVLFSKNLNRSDESRLRKAANARIDSPVIYLAGDESAAKGGLVPADRSRGYGEYLGQYFTIPLRNHAVSGATSRTFTEESHWKRLSWHLRPDDIVILNFGGSDEGDPASVGFRGHVYINEDPAATREVHGKDVHTYQYYMNRFIEDTKMRSAIPVIASAVHVDFWSVAEENPDDRVLWDSAWLCPRIYDPRLAEQTNTSFVDFHRTSQAMYQRTGANIASRWNEGIDNYIAVNETGARALAETFISAIKCGDGQALDLFEPYFTQAAKDVEALCWKA